MNVLNRYDEPHRFYHNRQHIVSMLNYLNDQMEFKESSYQTEILLAVHYHDAIYIPGSSTNEEESVELMYADLKDKESFREVNLTLVEELILATKDHIKYYTSRPTQNDIGMTDESFIRICQLFLEADLAIFKEIFDNLLKYEKNIRKEFWFYDDETYYAGRHKFLTKLQMFFSENFVYLQEFDWGAQILIGELQRGVVV